MRGCDKHLDVAWVCLHCTLIEADSISLAPLLHRQHRHLEKGHVMLCVDFQSIGIELQGSACISETLECNTDLHQHIRAEAGNCDVSERHSNKFSHHLHVPTLTERTAGWEESFR